MSERDSREHLLNAAAAVIVRQGYDKTTMSDIAAEAGMSRGTVYLYFQSKEDLLESLVFYEVKQYVRTWLDHIEANPHGGTIGGLYKAFLYAINSRPFMAAMMRRDRRVIGSYLRRQDNPFTAMQSSTISSDFLQALQVAGAVRADVDPQITSHILDIIGYGLLSVPDYKSMDELPPFDAVIETLADMLDRLLTPEGGGSSEAGKAVIRQLVTTLWAQIEQEHSAKESKRP